MQHPVTVHSIQYIWPFLNLRHKLLIFRYLLKLPSCCILTIFRRKEYAILNRRKGLLWKSVYCSCSRIALLFIVLLMGYVVVKGKGFESLRQQGLSVVFVYLVMPCVVLNAFQIDDTPQIRTGTLVLDGHSGRNACRVSGPQCYL